MDRIKLCSSGLKLRFDRSLAEGRKSRLLGPFFVGIFFIVSAAAALWISYNSFCLVGKTEGYGAEPFKPNNIFDAAYYLLFTNGGQNLYDKGHWLGVLITTAGIVFLAILTSSITNAFERIAQEYLAGERTYYFDSHTVIIGASDVIYSIIDQTTAKRILILTSRDVEKTRREVYSFLGNKVKRNRIVFFYGDRTSDKEIKRLSLARAREVFIIGDSEESDNIESYRDAYNMDCLEVINAYLKETHRKDRLTCHVMFEYQTTFAAFQFSEMGENFKELIDFRPFNFYDMWAQKVLVSGHAGSRDDKGTYPYHYDFLDTLSDGKYIDKDSDKTVHLIIVGMTKMGIAMGLQAAQICHFPNFVTDRKRRTRITFIDSDADIEKDYLRGRFHDLADYSCCRYIDFLKEEHELFVPWANEDSWLDVEWEFIKGRVENPKVQGFIQRACADKNRIVTLAICLPKSHQSIAAALYLPPSVFVDALQILTYQRLSGTIIEKIAQPEKESYRYKKMRPFGMIDDGYSPELDDDRKAKMVSYVYDSYYINESNGIADRWDEQLLSYHLPFNYYGTYYESYDQLWGEKKVFERISSQFNANTIDVKLRSIGASPGDDYDELKETVNRNLELLQQVEHNRWNVEKLLTGFRVLCKEELAQLESRRGSKDWSELRKKLKEWPNRAHLDLCDFKTLKKVEENTILEHDRKLNEAIPYIVKMLRTNSSI